jgi:hypothetical protein
VKRLNDRAGFIFWALRHSYGKAWTLYGTFSDISSVLTLAALFAGWQLWISLLCTASAIGFVIAHLRRCWKRYQARPKKMVYLRDDIWPGR